MRYICKDSEDNYGVGDSLEEAYADFLTVMESVPVGNLTWYETKKIEVEFNIKELK